MQPLSRLAVCLFATTLVQEAAAQSQRGSDTTELARLEQVWNQAHVRGDAAALDHLWANDLVVTVPNMPPMTRPEALAFARSGRMHFARYQTSDLRFRVYRDSAVVTGRLQRTRTRNGQTVNDDWRFTKVYVRQDDHWRVAVFRASAPPTPAPGQQSRLLPLTARVNSRVRFAETGPDSSWHYGMLNRLRVEPPCFVVLTFRTGMQVEREVPLTAVRRLQLSTYFDGSRGLVRWTDTTTRPGESWWEVPADTLHAAVMTCGRRG